jgi:hypothetical protein
MIGSAQTGKRSAPYQLIVLAALALAVSAVLAGCASSSTIHDNAASLSKLSWCDRPFVNFFDGSSANATSISDWSQVRGQLDFTLYLPPSLPQGSCLVLAGGTFHDAIYGSHVSITWDLPNGEPLSISEAPNRANVASTVQCAASAQDAKTTVCLGTIGSTSITLASRQSAASLQALFRSLKPNVDWVPFGTTQLLQTPTATP